MQTRRLLTFALALLVACGGSKPTPAPGGGGTTGTDGTASTSLPAPTGEDAPLPLWPAVKKGKLSNGLTYYILKHGKPENRVLLWLAVDAGSVQEDEDQRGLAHFHEHMAFNGTKRFEKQEIVNYLEKIGMGFGADLNATTSFDQTIYMLTVPADDKTFVSTGLDILRDWAADVVHDPKEIEKERGVVMEEWRLGRGAQERLFDKHSKVLFKGSRYAERLPIGKPEIIKTAPREAFRRYYEDWYRPDLMAVIAVGDIDPAQIEKEIQTKFGDLKNPAKERARIKGGVPTANGTRVSIATDKEMPATLLQIVNTLPHRSEASSNDFRRIIAEQIYGQIVNERLATLGRRQEAPYQVAQVAVQNFTRDIDTFFRIAVAKQGKIEDAIRALHTEAVRVEKHGFTQGELDRARANIARYYEQAAAGAETEDSSDYTAEITRNFFEGEFMIGRKAERDYTLRMLPTITLAELNQLAKSFGGADDRVILISGPEGSPMPTEKRVLEIVGEVEKSQIAPWEDKAAATALMAQPPKPGTVTKETKIDAIGVTEWTLSNGVRVILKPTDFEAEQVAITGDSPGGLAVADMKLYPHARFAEDVVGIGGVGELDDDALGKVLTGKQVAVSASIEETTESIDGSAGTRDLETMFQLLHLRMTAPRKDAEAFAVWKANMSEQLENRMRSPEVKYSIESQEALYKGNPRRTAAVPADIAKVDLDKAIAFYKDRFGDASDFTFTIVGAFDIAKVKPLVETYLASLPAKGRKEKEKDLGIKRVTGVVKKQWTLGSEDKATVSIQFHGAQPWTRDNDRDMFIVSQVVSMRLREILREDMGGVYGVGAGGYISRRPKQERTFMIQFGAAPAAVPSLIKAAFDEIAVISKQGIGADYLDKVKQAFLRDREVQLKTNGFWLGWLSSSARFGDDPTIVLDPSKMVARMTSDNVKAAAKRYIDPKQYYQAVLMPATGAAATPAPAPAKK